jgi:prepilin-type N-terminal cleavage/methylation domain-containing protein
LFKIFRLKKKDKGFTLVELLVVILIVGILAGIAVPIYLNQKNRAYLNSAREDAHSIGMEIYSILSDYTSFGTSAATNTITVSSGVNVTFGAMTAATGSSMALATGPGAVTTSTPKLTAGSTVSGTYGTTIANDLKWCIVVANNSTYVKYNETGEVAAQIGGTAPTCAAGV